MNNDKLLKEYSRDKNNIELRNRIVLNNLKLVPYTINRYHLYIEGIHDYDEMLQEGYISLIKAVETYNYDLGYRFSVYAIKCILSLTRSRSEYNKYLSLNKVIYNENSDTEISLNDILQDESIDIENDYIAKQLQKDINNSIHSCLNYIELKIIKSFYGIDEKSRSFKEIAKDLNMDISEVKKIRKKAETKIKKTKLFRSLKAEYYISYYPKFDLDSTRSSPTNKIYSPVEKIVFKKIDTDKSLLIETVHSLKKGM